MTLTFIDNSFQLQFPTQKIAEKLAVSSAWAYHGTYFKTDSFQAAAKFRRVADEAAEKILKRAFVDFYEAPLSPLPSFLDPHQVEGVNWVLTRSRSYLAHAPGAGKTCESITASILIGERGQTLFIVPPTLTANWSREILKWTEWRDMWPSIGLVPASDDQENMDWTADFIICPDSMLPKPWVLKELSKRKFKLIAVDEASRFKEATAQRTLALFGGKYKIGTKKNKTEISSSGLVANARHFVLLDGSPMPNRPMELWAPVFATAPETIDFMDQTDFGFHYCGARMNDFGRWEFRGASQQEALKAKLQEKFMHVVTEEMLSHPERRRKMLFMNEDVRSIEQKTWEHKHLKAINFSDIDDDMSEGDLARFRRELGLNKVPWVAEYVRDRVKSGESVLLFAWHREVCLRLRKALHEYRPGVIMGGTTAAEREFYFSGFQSGKRKLLILNIGAGGRGHNLQRADRVVFGEFSWTDELNKQCEKRASRKGSDKAVVPCDYIVAPNSLDEPVLNSVFTKAKNIKRVIG